MNVASSPQQQSVTVDACPRSVANCVLSFASYTFTTSVQIARYLPGKVETKMGRFQKGGRGRWGTYQTGRS